MATSNRTAESAAVLGVPARAGMDRLRFDGISRRRMRRPNAWRCQFSKLSRPQVADACLPLTHVMVKFCEVTSLSTSFRMSRGWQCGSHLKQRDLVW